MKPSTKKILIIAIIVAGILILAGLVMGVLAWRNTPGKTLNAFLTAVQNKDQATAMSLVSSKVQANKQENVQWFVEDWVISASLSSKIEKDEAWRSQTVPEKNKYGNDTTIIDPTPRYFAHHYQAYVTVTFGDGKDEYEDPVIIKLVRDTDNTWSSWAQFFKPWKISNIKYQPFDEEDFQELEMGEEDI
ncbi:MAG: hypothetical protein A2233_03530 [Candidatus Kerfeldbacteria bacterium RIFOXYA2_FULL_38_24]|uniref:Uncharacterized protein n=1 Tax=Candidatus Kerfeldbacteria bacterium RIFOXYB2_FULL_38_14 TaxID=1798547 RepID=A0A1G2BE59_9BACT|nr:MAG: hypothetical protein A2233_03530 [Candidatus Kerfeldbacteria bacterium RIFOXYA2_FULL_38_24]OGY87501.1 MAG: hypothetical protein A2319_04025 [Candidatus Kerfeldbacteria bacterium RIFOXYB2_FULL_38_14]OGY90237.1 MAG: hypothetical protein A2458_03720 [Candidatus Kerfeldbacteria bacterium RIFOXYC2_FULL_38_9]